MIVTLTMNPAIDRTVVLEELVSGGTNRVLEVHKSASGKGVNVSRALAQLGMPSVATGLLGGDEGRFIAAAIRGEQIKSEFTWLESGSTRINTKVYEKGKQLTTEINEAGPVILEQDEARLQAKLDEILAGARFLICSGSLPPGIHPLFYFDLINRYKEQDLKIGLDASGPPLVAGLKAVPDLIKPNQAEAETILGRKISGQSAVKKAMSELINLGIPLIVLSLGEEGAVFYQQGQTTLWAKAAAKPLRGTSGCGDALVAALVHAQLTEMSWQDTVRWATAAATATAELDGTVFPDPSHIEQLLPRVSMEMF